jgi:hypothetical protein
MIYLALYNMQSFDLSSFNNLNPMIYLALKNS